MKRKLLDVLWENFKRKNKQVRRSRKERETFFILTDKMNDLLLMGEYKAAAGISYLYKIPIPEKYAKKCADFIMKEDSTYKEYNAAKEIYESLELFSKKKKAAEMAEKKFEMESHDKLIDFINGKRHVCKRSFAKIL
jgi:hypothetical protein